MAVDLRTTRYNNGDEIPLVTANADWKTRATPTLCWYQNNWVDADDVCGHPIVELFHGYLEAGQRDFVWQGRERHGRQCPSARYFVRVKNGDRAQATSIPLVK